MSRNWEEKPIPPLTHKSSGVFLKCVALYPNGLPFISFISIKYNILILKFRFSEWCKMLSHELLEIWQVTYFIYSSSRYLALFLLFPIFRPNRSYFAISSFIHSTMESNSTRPNWCFYSCLKEGFLPEAINTANSAAIPGHLGFLRFSL